ncbi:MAG: binding domain of photolyase family protein [Hyphomicrobiales bacterium]|nr:binding domain of photolyase family protein [Hyphomicrobiales bacterium]
MGVLRILLGDQLSMGASALDGLDRARDVVLMMEVADETAYVPHHKQKIAFVLSAMRHFAGELTAAGVRVDYVRLDDPANTGSFTGEVMRAAARHAPERIVATWPGEWRVLEAMRSWEALTGAPVEVREDDRFIASRADFARWAGDRKQLRMEFFYREMRRATGLLMEGDAPTGGQWNFDQENRKALPKGVRPPERLRFHPDAVTREVMELVAARCGTHFGDLDSFAWPVTRAQALEALDAFVERSLPFFGDYQDAMKAGEATMFHALLSPALNAGLLDPREACAAAERAYKRREAPLNAVEGFIRQIIGWREYVRGLYWLLMPGYAQGNALEAQRPLPAFYWTGETRMNCMAQAIGDTRANAYAHHIQRLMVTGNFALLAGVRPAEIEAWYLAVYADAYEWVELPNVHGMAIFADGGVMASKPYAASGAYINRMSDYCGGCAYDVKARTGEGACPFNALYWAFLIRNEDRLSRNPRMAMPYRNLASMTGELRDTYRAQAQAFLDRVEANGTDA